MKRFRIEMTVECDDPVWTEESLSAFLGSSRCKVLGVEMLDITEEGEVPDGGLIKSVPCVVVKLSETAMREHGLFLDRRLDIDSEGYEVEDVEDKYGFDTWPCLDHHLGNEPWDVTYWKLTNGRFCIRTWCNCKGFWFYIEVPQEGERKL